ncbi:hypothetical protein EJ03DRAFT_263329 [Teratosphaeria nubilosa]|uniref:DUF1275 domain protein n=1 Tax=Teratosphaeria nubilosa TaxID=161662 RepID=A0A6G1LQ58_9PEZI|nr:hypothetical protein EJ03DRAFT_263329 [Teratosphaeria nubilosa]
MPTRQAWRTFFSQEVAKDHILELQLMLITISTGIQDATTFATYQVFTTKQTGNTLFLALYALRHQALGEAVEQNVGVSLGCFILGAALFGHIGRHLKQRRRAWLIGMNFFQVLLVLGAAAIRWWAPRVRAGGSALGVVALLSFASSGQIAMAVGVGLAELNTTMITGTLVQLSNDPSILKANNPARNRRVMFYTSLLAGCFIGAAAYKLDAALGLLLTAAVKLLATVSFFLNPGVVEVNNLDREKADERPRTGTITPVSKILWGD